MDASQYAGHADWTECNNRYLSASLQWLRLKLRKLLPPPAPAPLSADAVAASRRRWFEIRDQAPPPRPAIAGPTLDDEIESAARARAEAGAGVAPPALVLLAQRLGLSDFERDVLLLCAAVELDPALPALIAEVQTTGPRGAPSFALALQIFEQPSWEALSAHRPLRYARLIEINQGPNTPLTASALHADERIVNYLKGLNVLDERLAALLTPLRAAVPLSASQQAVADEVLLRLRQGAGEAKLPLAQLLGRDAASRVAVATQVAAKLERRLYQLPLEALPNAKAELDTLARLWQRETMLLPVALYIEAENLDSGSGELSLTLSGFLMREPGLVFVGLRETPVRQGGAAFTVEVPLPLPAEQRQAWQQALSGPLGALAEQTAQRLAGQFQLNFGDIAQATQQAWRREQTPPLSAESVWDACRSLSLPRLDALAQRLTPKATWEDLVAGDEQLKLLRQITAQVRERHRVYEDWGFGQRMNRGFGISALFAGESGTGKTMAAEVIANELRLHLYRIDLSAVVSKYIGETEKNLRRLFDAAEQGGAILFFDEADALFGKRSEVKDSHDRYANIEINYLLQRMEAFSGLAILATNMKSALDTAFMRRLRFIVQFAYPSPAERRRMWEQALPRELPRDGIDFDRLARFSLSGGNIHSVVLNAAFLAASSGEPLAMPALMAATRMELRKLEKPINEAEFR